ncbi:heme oxygenase [Sphingomonas sp. BE123]|uniref:biliverdin-producing heme oxygenase n=1 Tax=Sphingomonas sp. BE123 TaxID=2817842 RepID=UPI00285622D7|nr:biliverdin-producing heme oxygenase [Sphingomonas sp. BE123]MDR6852089.1 heme oxygenase [Sphingomonas sp. BE123]
MPPTASARMFLRAQTAADHDRVDRAFGAFDLSHRDGYRAFLLAQADALLPVEQAIDAAAPTDLLPDWPQRRRAPLLVADLVELGVAVAPMPGDGAPDLSDAAALLGAVYVLEGSRLGGSVLARGIAATLPTRFIGCATAPQRWRGLIEIMDKQIITEEQRATALAAARSVFDRFRHSASRHGRIAVVE